MGILSTVRKVADKTSDALGSVGTVIFKRFMEHNSKWKKRFIFLCLVFIFSLFLGLKFRNNITISALSIVGSLLTFRIR